MYPQYWTPGIGGIFMRYSYEYKKMCVELYRQGKWVETPEGVKEKNFRNMIQIWARTEESCGVEALRHKNQNKVWTAEEKYELVAKVLAGESNRTTAIAAGIDKKMRGFVPEAVAKPGKFGYNNLSGVTPAFFAVRIFARFSSLSTLKEEYHDQVRIPVLRRQRQDA